MKNFPDLTISNFFDIFGTDIKTDNPILENTIKKENSKSVALDKSTKKKSRPKPPLVVAMEGMTTSIAEMKTEITRLAAKESASNVDEKKDDTNDKTGE